MRLCLLAMLGLAALSAPAPAQPEPHARFIVCPGHERCPRRDRPRLPGVMGFALVPRPAPAQLPPPVMRDEAGAEVPDRIGFAPDSAELDRAAEAVLQAQAEWLDAHPEASISVEGHADENGDRFVDRLLALARAEAVAGFFRGAGIEPERVILIRWSEETPADPADDSLWRRSAAALTRPLF